MFKLEKYVIVSRVSAGSQLSQIITAIIVPHRVQDYYKIIM